jgi:putative ABC transport system permease protein
VLAAPLARVKSYVGLVALFSLLLASVGVAQNVSAWLKQITPETAILRCIGLRPREIFCIQLAQLALIALGGSIMGAVFGVVFPRILMQARPAFLPIALSFADPVTPALAGLVMGVLLPLSFSLPALLSVWNVSPARVLRLDAAPLKTPALARACTVLGAFAAAFLAAREASGQPRLALGFVVSCSALVLLLAGAARLLARLGSYLPRKNLPALVWQAVGAFARPHAGTTGSVVALGLGTFVIVAISLLQGIVGDELDHVLPAGAPNVFLLDLQPAQWPPVQKLFEQAGARHIVSTPLVSARLSAVNGRAVTELVQERAGNPNARGSAHWVLTREQRIASMRELPADNRIVAGSLWSDPHASELSLEVGFARALGAELGSVLSFDIQGVLVDLRVTSLRTLNFRSFALNFFMVAEPGALAEAPHVVLAGVRMQGRSEQHVQDQLAASYANVTMVRVENMIQRAEGALHDAALAVRVLGSFAIMTGLLILAGTIAATQRTRAREAALLKALGVHRAKIIAMVAVEHAVSGVLAGTLGAVVGYLLTTFLATHLLDLSTPASWLTCFSGVLCIVAMSVITGLAASIRTLVVRPLEVLRASL